MCTMGQVQDPQRGEHQRVAQPGGHEAAQREARPGHREQHRVGTVQPKQGGQPEKSRPGRAQHLADVI